jgi:hypothetical protein
MSVFHEAIVRAEAEVRALLERALAEGQYDQVAEGARVADALAHLRSEFLQGGEQRPRVSGISALHEREAEDPGPRRPKKEYPRFSRDGDRLVKVAWSKRDKAEYSHRAPRPVIEYVLERVRKRKGEGKPFQITDILPLRHPETRQEIPSYQAYLVIAWLRQLALISKRGRDRYVLKAAATPERVSEAWKVLPVEA